MVAYFCAVNLLLALLTDNIQILNICDEYISWAAVVPLAGVMAFVFDGVFVGMMKTRAMLMSIAVAAAVFFAVYFSFATVLGNHALWLAFLLYLFTRGIVELIAYRHEITKIPVL